jgi:hypothetical protein
MQLVQASWLSARVIHAVVFLKGFLRESIKGERRNGAFEVGCSHAPLAVGAAPATKVVTVDPDQAFVHTSTFVYERWDRNQAATGGLQKIIDAGGEILPVATRNLARNSATGEVTMVLRPIGHEHATRDAVRLLQCPGSITSCGDRSHGKCGENCEGWIG